MDRDRIGPNAIIQVIEALAARFGQQSADAFFTAAGLEHYVRERPGSMVSERDVAVLQSELRERFGAAVAREISLDAGRRTGDYLLANRIPRLAQRVLKLVPAALAARVLAKAISKHSWTFAGSGTFTVLPGTPFRFSIQHNPICSRIRSDAPACDYYAATFERIFRAIVHPQSCVAETQCEAMGATACVFEISWGAR
ncbi:MAG: bacteriochlorophyll 4-vinyl reductase [Burkholderiaceae bacterium]|nr:bacteriochlorophyll 4-vinyl reductase [Burkholderiaceae bacterium]